MSMLGELTQPMSAALKFPLTVGYTVKLVQIRPYISKYYKFLLCLHNTSHISNMAEHYHCGGIVFNWPMLRVQAYNAARSHLSTHKTKLSKKITERLFWRVRGS